MANNIVPFNQASETARRMDETYPEVKDLLDVVFSNWDTVDQHVLDVANRVRKKFLTGKQIYDGQTKVLANAASSLAR